VESWPDLSGLHLNWSSDSQSLLAGAASGVGGLWFCDVMSQSLSRLFKGYSFGNAVFSPPPKMSSLVFELTTQTTLWGQEIWLADISPKDCRAAQAGACQTVAQHHQEMIESCDNPSIAMDPNEPMNYLLRGARYLKSHQIEKALMDVENFARLEQDSAIRPDT
jgi:hypothetical protein